ncbi:ATP-binding cassette domain-containing protein [Actinocrispum wychmicini]|uniref:Peptide/nickel transport system ATP-binding protein/oligopeptide transport system ATP-binding protein n=1 Tax=Actinocrispum wychmicini TaxID=1213861 RepID=A0A4R2JDC1_9PSEU|nr:ATP-binding cassette domain-containing protein [Actinocrispum wychmicini]TCO52275.1 peptide/nickel transport system ATP-binding protein/oligopeptide transport system ATP-binding protein [Actinocrispum wychmicini]
MSEPLLKVDGLRVSFQRGRAGISLRPQRFDAVRGVSFDIPAGRTFGLVGESGSGKSTVGRAVLRLLRPTGGTIVFDGKEVTAFGRRTPRWYRRAVQVVFQDPLSSLNPNQVVATTLTQALAQNEALPHAERPAALRELLDQVGLAAHHARSLPRELSGGQRQRVAIARALAVRPRLIICDEPVSALDVSTQAQVINLLVQLQRDLGLSYLFVAHDLAVVRHMSHEIGVMYRGELVETGPGEQVYSAPTHPYTRMLLDSVPLPDPALQRRRRAERRTDLEEFSWQPTAS